LRGGRYRPLTVAMFAIVYQIYGKKSFSFHLLTVFVVRCSLPPTLSDTTNCFAGLHRFWLCITGGMGNGYFICCTSCYTTEAVAM
jgi:hypothetical protein